MAEESDALPHYSEWRETVELALARDAAVSDAPVLVLLIAAPDGRVASIETGVTAEDLQLASGQFVDRIFLPMCAAALAHLQPKPIEES